MNERDKIMWTSLGVLVGMALVICLLGTISWLAAR